MERIVRGLEGAFSNVGYKAHQIRVIELLHEFSDYSDLPHQPEEERYLKHIKAGKDFCERVGSGDALSLLALAKLRGHRKDLTGKSGLPAEGHVFILRSLKRQSEIEILRRLFGDSFILVAAYSPEEERVSSLAQRIAGSHHDFDVKQHRAEAEKLLRIDEREEDRFGQDVSGSFPLADVVVNASETASQSEELSRFVEILFGHPFRTPTKAEFGMAQASVAALRSADPGRQVGAAITTTDGQIIALGTNEVPKSGGGLYWVGDENDARDFRSGRDTSYELRKRALADTLQRIQEMGWLKENCEREEIGSLVAEALAANADAPLRDSRLMSTIEFGRAVHAEMAAITDAARRGIPIEGCILYSTTFPCHECARHIVSSGLRKVLYIEPYRKSLASDLFRDSVCVDYQGATKGRVSFEPFVGVAPRRFTDLFSMPRRKKSDGSLVKWRRERAEPRGRRSPGMIIEESRELDQFRENLSQAGLSLSTA